MNERAKKKSLFILLGTICIAVVITVVYLVMPGIVNNESDLTTANGSISEEQNEATNSDYLAGSDELDSQENDGNNSESPLISGEDASVSNIEEEVVRDTTIPTDDKINNPVPVENEVKTTNKPQMKKETGREPEPKPKQPTAKDTAPHAYEEGYVWSPLTGEWRLPTGTKQMGDTVPFGEGGEVILK